MFTIGCVFWIRIHVKQFQKRTKNYTAPKKRTQWYKLGLFELTSQILNLALYFGMCLSSDKNRGQNSSAPLAGKLGQCSVQALIILVGEHNKNSSLIG